MWGDIGCDMWECEKDCYEQHCAPEDEGVDEDGTEWDGESIPVHLMEESTFKTMRLLYDALDE